jgi:hypothetical protein
VSCNDSINSDEGFGDRHRSRGSSTKRGRTSPSRAAAARAGGRGREDPREWNEGSHGEERDGATGS